MFSFRISCSSLSVREMSFDFIRIKVQVRREDKWTDEDEEEGESFRHTSHGEREKEIWYSPGVTRFIPFVKHQGALKENALKAARKSRKQLKEI